MTTDPALPSPPPQPDAGREGPHIRTTKNCTGCRHHVTIDTSYGSDTSYGHRCHHEETHDIPSDHYRFTDATPDWCPVLVPRAPAPPGPAAAVEYALHAALAERDANAQTAKAMSRLHDDAEKEIEELHASLAELAERGRGASRLAALERVAAEARKLATVIPATSGHLDGLNEAIRVLDGGT